MSKYISYKIEGEYKKRFKIHSSEESKTFWDNLEPNLNFITITDDEFTKLKNSFFFRIDENNNLNFTPHDPASSVDISQDIVKKKLDEHIEEAKAHLTNHDNPLISNSYISYLKSIDLNAITWPVQVSHKDNWVEALELNSYTLDNIAEL